MILHLSWEILNRHDGHGIADAMLGLPLKGHLKIRTKFSALPGCLKRCRKEKKMWSTSFIFQSSLGAAAMRTAQITVHTEGEKNVKSKNNLWISKQSRFIPCHISFWSEEVTLFLDFAVLKHIKQSEIWWKWRPSVGGVINAGRSLWDKNVFVINFE